MSGGMNIQVALDVMGHKQLLRKHFAEGPGGDKTFDAMSASGAILDTGSLLTCVPDYVEKDWPEVIEAMGNKPQGYKLKLMRFTDGWYAVFVPWEEKIETADWQATQFAKPGEAVCHAALRRCQS